MYHEKQTIRKNTIQEILLCYYARISFHTALYICITASMSLVSTPCETKSRASLGIVSVEGDERVVPGDREAFRSGGAAQWACKGR